MGIFDATVEDPKFVPNTAVDTTTGDLVKFTGGLAVEATKGKLKADLQGKFEKIKAARDQGKISVDRAEAAISSAIAESGSIFPGFLSDFRRQAGDYFGKFGPGGTALDQTFNEQLQESIARKFATDMATYGLDYNNPSDKARYTRLANTDLILKEQTDAIKLLDNNKDLQSKKAASVGAAYISQGFNKFNVQLQKLNESKTSLSSSDIEEALGRLNTTKQDIVTSINTEFAGIDTAVKKDLIDQANAQYETVRQALNDRSYLELINKHNNELVGVETTRLLNNPINARAMAVMKVAGSAGGELLLKASNNPQLSKLIGLENNIFGASPTTAVVEQALSDDAQLDKVQSSIGRVSNGQIVNELDAVTAQDLLTLSSRQKQSNADFKLSQASMNAATALLSLRAEPEKIPLNLVKEDGIKQKIDPIVQSKLGSLIPSLLTTLVNRPEQELVELPNGKITGRVTSDVGFPRFPGTIPYESLRETEAGRQILLLNDLLDRLRETGHPKEADQMKALILGLNKEAKNIRDQQAPEDPGLFTSLFQGIKEALPAFWEGLKRAAPAAISGVQQFEQTAQDIQANPSAAVNKPDVIHVDENGDTIPQD